MSALSGWDYQQPPGSGPAPAPHDDSGEPVGYNLGGPPIYQQPPLPLLEPYHLPAPTPKKTWEVAVDFGLSLVGLAIVAFVPSFTLPISGFALVGSAMALIRSRRASAGLPRLAVAGLVLAAVGLVLAFFLVAASYGSSTSGP
jgi:hypothetical protein